MKVFLDTNIIIDFFQGRDNARLAGIILELGRDGEIDLCLTDLTLVNFFYICRKTSTAEQRMRFMEYLRTFVTVLSIGQENTDKSIAMRPKDFEDCMQYNAAKSANVDLIVTSNKEDFLEFGTNIYTPSEFLDRMNIEY